MAPTDRSIQFKMLLAPYERRILDQLADEEGITASDFLRGVLRKTFTAKFGEEEFRRERRRDTQKARQAEKKT